MSGAQVAMMVNTALGSLFAVAMPSSRFRTSPNAARFGSASAICWHGGAGLRSHRAAGGRPGTAGRRRLHQFSDGDAIDLGHLQHLLSQAAAVAANPLILALGVALRLWIWSLPSNTLVYGIAYQLPFSLASILATRSVLAVRPHRGAPPGAGWRFCPHCGALHGQASAGGGVWPRRVAQRLCPHRLRPSSPRPAPGSCSWRRDLSPSGGGRSERSTSRNWLRRPIRSRASPTGADLTGSPRRPFRERST